MVLVPKLWIMSEAADEFGVDIRGISALVKSLGIPTHPVRSSHRAKAIDYSGMTRLARALDKTWPSAQTAESA